VDTLTLWQVHELFEYWNEHPPVHVLVGAYLGARKPSSGSKEELMRDVAAFQNKG
jgi:hypothetical protein